MKISNPILYVKNNFNKIKYIEGENILHLFFYKINNIFELI